MLKNNISNVNTIFNIITIIAIALIWFGSISAHVDDELIHTNYQEQAKNFVPRSEFNQILIRLNNEINRLSDNIDKLEIKIEGQ